MARILIIDDESNIRLMLRLALEHVGHTVELAADGTEGLEKFGHGRGWDLILLDHRMPGLEGLDVLKELHRRRPQVRVIMITAFGTVDLASEALLCGVTDFLRKPFTIEVLREAVSAALAIEPSLSRTARGASLLSFQQIGINGYRLVSLPGLERLEEGVVGKVFSVQKREGAGRACRVFLSLAFQERVREYVPPHSLTEGDAFWEALCGEALANYLWQNAQLPTGGQLWIEELTRGLQRWMDTFFQPDTPAQETAHAQV